MQVYEITEAGGELILTVVEDGNIFGEMTLTGQSLKGVYVRALVPSYVCSIGREHLETLILSHPQVGLEASQGTSRQALQGVDQPRGPNDKGRTRKAREPDTYPGRLRGIV